MDQNEWLAISYTLPREPSRTRVSIWRKLKKTSAVSIQQSMWILPFSDTNYTLLNEVKKEVQQNGGEAIVITFRAADEDKNIIVEKFNAARDEEYGELLEQCGDFFKEIDKEIARKNFTFAEIEENEEELRKLEEWYEKIEARDALHSPLQEKAKATLTKCAGALELFCDKVYEYNEKA